MNEENREKKHKIGFLINPIAGMGGSVGLKGTDGREILELAISKGAKEVSNYRALNFLKKIQKLRDRIFFYTASGKMGELALESSVFGYEVVYHAQSITTGTDTIDLCKELLNRDVELIVFFGGDGTARDIITAVDEMLVIIGIPSGVKMYSSIFSNTIEEGAEAICDFINRDSGIQRCEILDIDEKKFREDELVLEKFGTALTINSPLVQHSKETSPLSSAELDGIALEISELISMDEETIFLFGTGSTVLYLENKLGVQGSLLGIDIVQDKRLIRRDADEEGILDAISGSTWRRAKIIVTPIGGQGFIFGRGNLQFTAKVIEEVGIENIIIVSTTSKIEGLKGLRVDSQVKFPKWVRVITGYRREKLIKVL